MNEKDLIKLWNRLRMQIIIAQIAPSLVLIGVFSLAAMGKFDMATDGAKFLAIGVAAVTGILAIISQYAAVREGEALVADLAKVSNPSILAKRIADSRGLLSISAIAITGFGIGVFALVVWAILG
jgi:aldehyde:ferredoxin oxidoreductase